MAVSIYEWLWTEIRFFEKKLLKRFALCPNLKSCHKMVMLLKVSKGRGKKKKDSIMSSLITSQTVYYMGLKKAKHFLRKVKSQHQNRKISVKKKSSC